MRTLIITALLALTATTCHADPLRFRGSLGIETPITEPDRVVDRSPMAVWNLTLPNVAEKWSIWFNGQYQTRDIRKVLNENKFRLGIEHPLIGDLTAYTYWERRYSLGTDRYVVGLRWNFAGSL